MILVDDDKKKLGLCTVFDDDTAGVLQSDAYPVDVPCWSPDLTPVGFVVRDIYKGGCHHYLDCTVTFRFTSN